MPLILKRKIFIKPKDNSPAYVVEVVCSGSTAESYLVDTQKIKKNLTEIIEPLAIIKHIENGYQLLSTIKEKFKKWNVLVLELNFSPSPEETLSFRDKDSLTIMLNYNLNASHFLKICGPSADISENLHGHSYKIGLDLLCENPSEKENLQDLSHKVVSRELITPYSGQILNQHFKITTGEMLAKNFYEKLLPTELGPYLIRVNLTETEKNSFSYP